MFFSAQTKDFAHFHPCPPLDLLIEIKELSPQPSRRCFADRRLSDAG